MARAVGAGWPMAGHIWVSRHKLSPDRSGPDLLILFIGIPAGAAIAPLTTLRVARKVRAESAISWKGVPCPRGYGLARPGRHAQGSRESRSLVRVGPAVTLPRSLRFLRRRDSCARKKAVKGRLETTWATKRSRRSNPCYARTGIRPRLPCPRVEGPVFRRSDGPTSR